MLTTSDVRVEWERLPSKRALAEMGVAKSLPRAVTALDSKANGQVRQTFPCDMQYILSHFGLYMRQKLLVFVAYTFLYFAARPKGGANLRFKKK